MLLLHFISDLDRSVDLQAAFLTDPVSTMRKAGLLEAQAAAFASGDIERIATAVAAEVRSMPLRPRNVRPQWIGPRLRLTAIVPNRAEAGESATVTIYGLFFPPDLTCSLLSTENQREIAGKVSDIVGGIQSQATVRFAVGSAGVYDVQASGIFENEPESDVLRAGFTVTAA